MARRINSPSLAGLHHTCNIIITFPLLQTVFAVVILEEIKTANERQTEIQEGIRLELWSIRQTLEGIQKIANEAREEAGRPLVIHRAPHSSVLSPSAQHPQQG